MLVHMLPVQSCHAPSALHFQQRVCKQSLCATHSKSYQPLLPQVPLRTLHKQKLPLKCLANSARIHIALSVSDVEASVEDYSSRLATRPCVVVSGQYALWRTDTVNFSVRQSEPAGVLRHLGFEDSTADAFTEEKDCNGLTWEHFSAQQQAEEVNNIWPDTRYQVQDKTKT